MSLKLLSDFLRLSKVNSWDKSKQFISVFNPVVAVEWFYFSDTYISNSSRE